VHTQSTSTGPAPLPQLLGDGGGVRGGGLRARKVSGRPKRCKLAHAFLREYSYKRLQLAQLLGQLGVSHLGGGRVAGAALGADAVRPHDALDVRGVLACTRNSQGWPRILITSVTKSNRDFRSNCCMGQLANFGPTHCAFQDLHI
jgi:hypothetical protein